MKSQQTLEPRGTLAGPTQMMEHTTYRSYTQATLVYLVNQFCQRPG